MRFFWSLVCDSKAWYPSPLPVSFGVWRAFLLIARVPYRDEGMLDCWGLLWVLYSEFGVPDRAFACYNAGSQFRAWYGP